jgi:phosphoribosylformimino-5-aminoimidazole carboxamide ribotide isomerase
MPVQREAVQAIVEAFGPGVQVGGGVRTREAFDAYVALGVERVVLGSAAVKDPAMVSALATAHPGKVVIAVDARDGLVAVDGWTEATRVRATDLVQALGDLPLGGVLYTDVARDGTRVGPNVEATAELAKLTRAPVIASGGVGSLDDLRTVAARGIAACIVGRALYEGAFTLEEAVEAAR